LRPGIRPVITGYALGSSRPPWQLTWSTPVATILPMADEVLVIGRPQDQGQPADEFGTLAALDSSTGRMRWQQQGSLAANPRDAPLLITVGHGVERSILAVEPATGEVLWRRPVLDRLRWTLQGDWFADDADAMVEVLPSGAVTVVDLRTGRQTPGGPVAPGGVPVFAWRGLLALSYAGTAGTRQVRVHRLGSSDPMWTLDVPADVLLRPCAGNVFCDWNGSDLAADPWTGRRVQPSASPLIQRIADRGVWVPLHDRGDAVLAYSGGHEPGPGWLGRVYRSGRTPRVTPLLQLPGRIDGCILGEAWVVCTGLGAPGVAGQTYAVLRADLDRTPRLR